MQRLPSSLHRALRRSNHRTVVLLALSALGEAYAGQLAEFTGIRRDRVLAALVGSPGYSPELSLVHLGMARVVDGARGRQFEITGLGRRKARSVVASQARRVGIKHRLVEPMVARRLEPHRATGPLPDGAPSGGSRAASSSSWSFSVPAS